MVLSSNNRKSFPLNLHIPPLPKSPVGGLASAKDNPASQSVRSLQSVFAPSPSRSAFLSPRNPLPPASLHLKQEQPIIPIPLNDGLDPSERMKLLRKSRKLSRILGEVPITVAVDAQGTESRFLGVSEEPSLTSASTSASSEPAQTPSEVGNEGYLKRSATVSHNRHLQQKEIHRARSLASLRPSLSIPAAAITVHSPPISPVVFSWPERNPIPPSPISPVAPSEEDEAEPARSKRDSVVSRRNSVASSIFPAERTPEQVLRARAAKLARQLGDNIPPEVLLRASSPQPRSPPTSPSVVSFAEASLAIREPPQRTSSTRRARGDRRDPKRRLSLDIRTFVRVPEPPVPSPSLSDTEKYSSVLPKNKKRRAGKKGLARHATIPHGAATQAESVDVAPPAVEADSDVDSDLDGAGPRLLSLEKQRAMNVRRARKMLQVFGNEPPPALFQITNIPPSATDEGISVALSITHHRRDSSATTASLPASTLSVPGSHHEQRDSVGTLSSGENLSPLIFADPASVPPSRTRTPPADGDAKPLPALPPSQDTILEVRPSSQPSASVPTLASSSLQSLSLASTISIPASQADSVHSQAPLSSPIRPSFHQPSPPANQAMFLWGPASAPTSPPMASAPLPEPAGDVHPSDPHFRVRRLRAAKLSRFFGVGLNDIAGMLRPGSSAGAAPTPSSPPPLREFRRSDASESIPSPVPARDSTPSPTSTGSTTSGRPVTSAGIVDTPSVSFVDEPRPRKRTLSSSTRSRSLSHGTRRPQTQPAMQPAPERNRSNSQPEVLSQHTHNRAFSTTVEVAAESKGPFAFLDGRRPSKVKELHMHDVIRELRKIK